MAFAPQAQARLLLGPHDMRGLNDDAAGFTFMLRTGRSRHPRGMLVAPLRHRHFYRCREPRYRGPWHLPGPDLHRLAILSLAPGYIQSPFIL